MGAEKPDKLRAVAKPPPPPRAKSTVRAQASATPPRPRPPAATDARKREPPPKTKTAAPQTVHDAAVEAREALRPGRAIGGSLNALMRATALYRKGVEKFSIVEEGGASVTQRECADRVARAWRKAKLASLEIEALRITVGGEEALRTDNEHSQWVLFAFMAGVRKITPKRVMTASDILRLVQALVALEASVESIERFRDWIDADGAEGFEVRVHTSFREVLEEIDLEEEREFSRAFAQARFEVPRSGDAVYIAARDLDQVAMRREFEVPIEMYASTDLSQTLGGLSDDMLTQVGRRCDDANAWATAEIEAVLALPELRSAVTPEHMARRVVTRLSEEADEQFLMLLTRLNVKNDPFRMQVAEALGTSEVGEIIARQLELTRAEVVDALGRFLALSPPQLASVVVGGVLERATEESDAIHALSTLIDQYGSAQLCEWVPAAQLVEESASLLGKVVGDHKPPAVELNRIALGVAAPVAVALLEALPTDVLREIGRTLRVLYGRVTAKDAETLVELMARGASPENLRLLADLLVEGKADGLRGRSQYALCAALVEHGLGRSHVLPLALRRGAKEQLRLVALDCLKADAELAAEASRFRVSKFLETPAIRERLKQLAEVQRNRGAGA